MPRLPIVPARDCIKVLQRIGFTISRQKGSHITLHRANPAARITVPNHGTLKPGMLHKIIKDAGLTVDEFIDLLK